MKEGTYVHKPAENKWHFVQITRRLDGSYKWKNNADVTWTLFPIPGKSNLLTVEDDCPSYKNGYTTATFNETGIFGPFDEFYTYQGL